MSWTINMADFHLDVDDVNNYPEVLERAKAFNNSDDIYLYIQPFVFVCVCVCVCVS